MKVLAFSIGTDRYGLRLRAIARVLPAVQLKQVPLAPPFVAGVMDLHGEPVPVIDVSRLAGFTPEQVWIDSRIVLVDFGPHKLGLLAEHVLGIETIEEAALTGSGVDGAPFLGEVAPGAAGMLQLIEVDELLAPDVRALLFPAGAPA